MRKQLEDFLINLTDFYPITSTKSYDNVIAQAVDYLMEFCYNKQIDFKKARNFVFENYKFKSFPDMALLKDAIQDSVIRIPYQGGTDDGCVVIITLPNGKMYDFEVCGFGNDIEALKSSIRSKHGNCQISTYPKGTVLIGNEIFR